MIKFYKAPLDVSMQLYNGETGGRDWDDASYNTGLPTNWSANNTEARIKAILQARASAFAFKSTEERAVYMAAVSDTSSEVLVVLKGIHQYNEGKGSGVSTAHLTVAWTTHLYHFEVKEINGSAALGVASLGVREVTEGKISISSAATGWTTVGKH